MGRPLGPGRQRLRAHPRPVRRAPGPLGGALAGHRPPLPRRLRPPRPRRPPLAGGGPRRHGDRHRHRHRGGRALRDDRGHPLPRRRRARDAARGRGPGAAVPALRHGPGRRRRPHRRGHGAPGPGLRRLDGHRAPGPRPHLADPRARLRRRRPRARRRSVAHRPAPRPAQPGGRAGGGRRQQRRPDDPGRGRPRLPHGGHPAAARHLGADAARGGALLRRSPGAGRHPRLRHPARRDRVEPGRRRAPRRPRGRPRLGLRRSVPPRRPAPRRRRPPAPLVRQPQPGRRAARPRAGSRDPATRRRLPRRHLRQRPLARPRPGLRRGLEPARLPHLRQARDLGRGGPRRPGPGALVHHLAGRAHRHLRAARRRPLPRWEPGAGPGRPALAGALAAPAHAVPRGQPLRDDPWLRGLPRRPRRAPGRRARARRAPRSRWSSPSPTRPSSPR